MLCKERWEMRIQRNKGEGLNGGGKVVGAIE